MDTFNTYMSNIPTEFFKSLCLKYGSAYTYKKGEYISKEGDIFPYWGYIESGIIKYTCYNVTEKKEYNTGFSFAGEFMADYPKFEKEKLLQAVKDIFIENIIISEQDGV